MLHHVDVTEATFAQKFAEFELLEKCELALFGENFVPFGLLPPDISIGRRQYLQSIILRLVGGVQLEGSHLHILLPLLASLSSNLSVAYFHLTAHILDACGYFQSRVALGVLVVLDVGLLLDAIGMESVECFGDGVEGGVLGG